MTDWRQRLRRIDFETYLPFSRNGDRLLNGLPLLVYKKDGELSTSEIKLLGLVWTSEQLLKDWNEWTIVPIYDESYRCLRENHRGISLLIILFKRFTNYIAPAKGVRDRTKPVSDAVGVPLTKSSLRDNC